MVEVQEKVADYSNDRISKRNQLDIFYKDLNTNTKDIDNTISSGYFMSLCWELAAEILDRSLKLSEGGILEWKKKDLKLILLVLLVSGETYILHRINRSHN